MAKKSRTEKTRKAFRKGRRAPPRGVAPSAPSGSGPFGSARLRPTLEAAPKALLHPHAPEEPVWRYLWPVLALAFAIRAAVALSGDFVAHPDEVMQYLEQGHRLAFGNGILYWEFWYGARSWLIPGLVAGILTLFDVAGLGQPLWYVGGVKLTFCALSLAVPAGMYFFARWHFGEGAARIGLLAGAFWYELVGFAHKPMTEFLATGLLMGLLALCVRPGRIRPKIIWSTAFLAVLAAAIRMQYAPVAILLLVLLFLRAGEASGRMRREGMQFVLAATLFISIVGVFDAVTWDAEPFHSYFANLQLNLALQEVRSSSPIWKYLWWLQLTSAGLCAMCLALSLRDLRRYGLLLALIALVLIVHSVEAHKEYRFVFVITPLWLLAGADVANQLASRLPARPAHLPGTGFVKILGMIGALFAAASIAGILNALPRQDEGLGAGLSNPIRFIRDQDPMFAAYRYLADAPEVSAVWHVDRFYHDLPGYYYLHRKIPFYDRRTGLANNLHADLKTLRSSVSHLVTSDPNLAVPGYAVEKEFDDLRILRQEERKMPLRGWRTFTPSITDTYGKELMRLLYPDAPVPPANFNIRFAEPK